MSPIAFSFPVSRRGDGPQHPLQHVIALDEMMPERAGNMDHDYNQNDVSQNPMAVFKQFVDRPITIGVDRRK